MGTLAELARGLWRGAAAFVTAAALAAAAVHAQQPTPTPLLDGRGQPLPFGVPPYFKPDYPLGSGPYKAVMFEEKGLSAHVVYAPADLAKLGARKLPVVIWANGSCLYVGNRYRQYLTEIASHGYLVVAGGPMGPVELEVGPQSNPVVRRGGAGQVVGAGARAGRGANPTPTPDAGRGGQPANRVTVEMLEEAVEWVVTQSRDASSRFHNRIDLDHIVSMGHSCGGVLALQLAQEEPRIAGLGVWFSGIGLTGGDRRPATIEKIKGPVLLITGEESLDVGYPAGKRTFDAIDHLPVFYGWQTGLQHIGTFGARNGGDLGVITTNWLDWTTRGDVAAGRMFKGPDCTLCKDPSWHVQKKKID
jgi:dienelactone hydrolase